MISGFVLLIFWGFFSNYQLEPEWFGVLITVAIQLIVMTTMISLRSLTIDSLDYAFDFIDEITVKKAWI